MGDFWVAVAALGTVVVPMALAWWLLGRPSGSARPRRDSHGKMPAEKER